jgi:preflagellin peptidase FlaK
MEDVLNAFRVLTILAFGYAAWEDVKTRRVYDVVWIILAIGGVAIFVVDMITSSTAVREYKLYLYFLSSLPLGLLGILFARGRLFGWADAGGFIAIGVLFPVVLPIDIFAGVSLPLLVYGSDEIMSYTILVNASILALASPMSIAVRNIHTGDFEFPYGIYLLPIDVGDIWSLHGSIAYLKDDAWVRGCDVDVIRKYLHWRGCSIECLSGAPSSHRNKIDDSSVGNKLASTDTSTPLESTCQLQNLSSSSVNSNVDHSVIDSVNDPWEVNHFIDTVDGDLHGSTKGDIENSLDQLFVSDTSARVSLGQPFLLFLFLGLVFTLTFGSIYHIVYLFADVVLI